MQVSTLVKVSKKSMATIKMCQKLATDLLNSCDNVFSIL